MKKLSMLTRTGKCLLSGLSLAVLMGALAGCGGGGSDTAAANPPSPPSPPPPAAIEGIATPSSVAVVTATNAQ